MNKYPRWKYVLIIVLTIIGFIYAVPNLYGEEPAIQISAISGEAINNQTTMLVKSTLQQHEIRYQSVAAEDKNLLIRFYDPESQLKAQDILKEVIGDNYSIALNLASKTPNWLTNLGANPMKLGLDLRGGIHFLIALDIDSLLQRNMQSDVRNMGSELRSARIRYTGLNTSKDGTINISFKDEKDLDKANNILANRFPELDITKVTDNGLFALKAKMSPAALLRAQNYAVEQNTMILRNRINELGIAEPVVQRQGADRISVDLPGIQDTARAKQILGGTATLEFHLVDAAHDAVQAKASGQVPMGDRAYDFNGRPVLLKNQIVLSGGSITGAIASVGDDGRPSVAIRLSGGEEALFYRITGENIGKPLAIVFVETKMKNVMVDDKMTLVPHKSERVINVATIQSALGNNFQITGLASAAEARDLSLLLRAGALLTPISIIQESTLGPSMGKENISKGIFSIEIGFIMIVIFMAAYYRLMGLIANVALFLNLMFTVAVLSILGATLTLPGIAGMVLVVGMAVDANVLIFERIREEIRNGLSPHASIKAGYERAFATIVDSNVTTLIAVVALFGIGTGAIKGFAVTTMIGIVISMFTAVTVTRALVQLVYGQRNIKKVSIGI